jgi:hypothetical protein
VQKLVGWIGLVVIVAAASALISWWTVPVVAAVWGLLASADRGVWWKAGVAGAAAWALLLAISASQASLNALATRIGGIFGLTGFMMMALTVTFAAVLAGSAAEFAASLASTIKNADGPS